ncbi:MAG TPA: TetR/AcrR family transcriptional regulator [Acidimicrobiales bacterium]|nr:TetR/AcrR family transcriptional regulator [Acidimicrobiales bacterium]
MTAGGDTTEAVVDLPFTEAPSADGRVARGQRTRRRVADALVALLRDGDPDPTAKSIAERAGVSLRLVFHHFCDMDDLYRTVASLQLERQLTEIPEISPDAPLRTRIDNAVHYRSELFEDIAPVRRAAGRRTSTSPDVTAAIMLSNTLLAQNLSGTFAPELSCFPEDEGAEVLAAIDAATSWEAWERMRRGSDLSVATARRVMTRMLSALLVARS